METAHAVIVHPNFRHTLPDPPGRPSSWEDLPDAILHQVTSYLETAQDLCRFANLCQRCKLTAYDEKHWHNLCLKKFHVPLDTAKPPSWRALYKFNHVFFYRVIVAEAIPAMFSIFPRGAPNVFFGVPVFA